jgi:Zn-dependent peptidase ImmA (M78 family)
VRLAELRAICPHRPLNLGESLRVAEVQAARLLQAAGITEPFVPSQVIADFPRIRVRRLSRIPVSGATHWGKGTWVIVLNRSEPEVRQRFSLCHEFKHCLDAPYGDRLYPAWRGLSSHERSELVADHFAAAVLMPRGWVKRAVYDEGTWSPYTLARRFGVSVPAMRRRLDDLGVLKGTTRCAGVAVA